MRRAVWPWLRILAGAAIIAVLVWRLGTGAFTSGLRLVDGPAIAAALLLGLATTVASAARWCLVVRRLGLRLSLPSAVADYYRSLFLNTILPGGVLGDVHRAVRHGQSSGDVARGVRAVAIERTGGQVVLAAAGVGVLFGRTPVVSAARVVTPVSVAALGALGLVLTAGTLWGRHTAFWRRQVTPALADVRHGLLARDTWPGVILLSAVGLAGHLALFLVAARVSGSPASFARLLPLMVLALFAMGLPINIGGWGPREGVTAWAFGAAGLGAAQGLTIAVVYGVLSFVASAPGVLVMLVRYARRPHAPVHEVSHDESHAVAREHERVGSSARS